MSCCRKKERPTLVKLFCDSFEQYSKEAAQADLQLETTNPYPRHKLKMGKGLCSVSFSAYCPEKFAQLQQLTGLLLPVRLLPALPCCRLNLSWRRVLSRRQMPVKSCARLVERAALCCFFLPTVGLFVRQCLRRYPS